MANPKKMFPMITVEEELNKNPELMEEHLENIRDWISKQPHLPINITDQLIIMIMHSCNYHMEECKKTIDQYYTLRTHQPEIFSNRDFYGEENKRTMKTFNVLPLNGRTKEGYKVVLMGFHKTDPHLFNFTASLKLIHMIADATFLKKGTMPGFIMIVDFSGVKMGHISKVSVSSLKKAIAYLQEGFPVRLIGTHYFNTGPLIDLFFSTIKPFMKKELLDILYLHPEGSDTLYNYVPKDMLPKEYGGSGGKIKQLREKSFKIVEEFQDWYKEDELMRVDESKRSNNSGSVGLFGANGSFRRLSIDIID